MYKRPRRYGRRPRRINRRPRRVVKRPRGAFKKKVLKVIHEQAEDKEAHVSGLGVNFNSPISFSSEFYQALPAVIQGTDSNNRIGDCIRGKYLEIKGHINMALTTDTDANTRIGVRLMVLNSKISPFAGSSFSSTHELDKFLKSNGSVKSFEGVIQDLYLPINRDVWTVHYDKKYYLSIDQLYHTSATDIEVSRNVRFTTKFFSMRIPCKKLLRYMDGASHPSNWNPRICLGYAHIDGSTPDLVETQVTGNWICRFVFEDV